VDYSHSLAFQASVVLPIAAEVIANARQERRISTGTIVGIIIGIVMAVVSTSIAVVYFVFISRRKDLENTFSQQAEMDDGSMIDDRNHRRGLVTENAPSESEHDIWSDEQGEGGFSA
jgi:hypothetical protein